MNEISVPTVSVILPTHNRAALLKRSIKSILNQTYKDFELIVIDDASTDDTEDVVRNFGDKRIRYIKQRVNMGAQVARNAGITASKGKYIAFQDDDDEWLPAKLEKHMKVFEETSPEADISFSDVLWFGKGSSELRHFPDITPADGIIYKKALDNIFRDLSLLAIVVRKKVFDAAGGFDERLPRWQDYEFLLRASKYALFYHMDEPTIKCYQTPGSISSNRDNLIIARKIIVEKYYDDYIRFGKRAALADHLYRGIGHPLCQKGEMKEGRRYILQAVKVCPWFVKAITALPVMFFNADIYNRFHKF